MGVIELVMIGLALSMDAFAVTVSDVFAYPRASRKRLVLLPIAFGIFQGLMPVLGYGLGSLIAGFFEQFAGLVSLLVLGFIGGKMIWEGAQALCTKGSPIETTVSGGSTGAQLTATIIVAQAVATSLDALFTGVSLLAEGTNIVIAAVIIATVTLLSCLAALLVGKRFGVLLGDKAQIIGGVVLLLIGLKAFFF
ncbi:MAG: manganese efflux pump [Coriobacteriaceae bacterium]|nr:manganese efflux pump [Coriobacteriaceae bacterium]